MIEPTWESDCGTVRLWLGDCQEVMASWPEKSVDLFVTDPPYGIGFEKFGGSRRGSPVQWRSIAGDDKPRGEWLCSAFSAVASGSALYLWCRQDVEAEWRQLTAAAGFEVKQRLAWFHGARGKGDLSGTYAPDHEDILFSTKGRHKFSGGRPSSVIRGVVPTWSKRYHPHQKPVSTAAVLIRTSSREGDVVADPFFGSGSIGVAAVRLGRRFWGCELDEEYFEITRSRISTELRKAKRSFGALSGQNKPKPTLLGDLGKKKRRT